MWARKRLDIGWSDLASATCNSLKRTPPTAKSITQGWFPPEQSLVCLSVRSGFDLLLQALQLPPGSEVILSAVTIPDMLQIIEHHGLVPVPIEVDPTQLEPSAGNIELALTAKSRLILLAHLFGTQTQMAPIIELANRHRLFVVEDCAQAFVGKTFAGHPESDASLFSFGPIKTATALGGAVVRIKQPHLLSTMRKYQQSYEPQSRSQFLIRIAKYSALKAASYPWLYGMIARICRAMGICHDRLINQLGHNFHGNSLIKNIRRQPCAALLWLLSRRLKQSEPGGTKRFRRRKQLGRYLTRRILGSTFHWAGETNRSHSYWVLAVCTTHAARIAKTLRQAGFDATIRSSLCNALPLNQAPTDQFSATPNNLRWLEQTVFVPCDPGMPLKEIHRLRRKLRETLSNPTGCPQPD